MKIGILTLPLHTNYGGILQAYAFQTVLERMGHEVKVIDRPWRKQINWIKFPLQLIKRCIKRFILHRNVSILAEKEWNKNQIIFEKYTREFIDKYIKEYRIEKISDIKENDFDAIIVGSDQIWRPKYYRLHYKNVADAFLFFARNWHIKRISYAASFGTDKWEYTKKETLICQSLIKKFDFVSVRENTGIDLCRQYFETQAEWVLDPTFLLQPSDYIKLVKEANIPQNKRDLFCYILDMTKEKKEFIQDVAKNNNFTSHILEIPRNNKDNEKIVPPVEEWLNGFYNSEFVITDSFHGCVFSIIFKKNFLAIGNTDRGMSRFTSLLSLLGLESNIINLNDKNTATVKDFHANVYENLTPLKGKSITFLKNSLS